MKTSRTSLPLYEEDREAIKVIREHYGVRADADAIRIALRELRRIIEGRPSTPASEKEQHSHHAP